MTVTDFSLPFSVEDAYRLNNLIDVASIRLDNLKERFQLAKNFVSLCVTEMEKDNYQS